MARTALTPQRATSTGLELTPPAANADGHAVPLRPGLAMLIRNDDVADHTATILTPPTTDGLDVADQPITITAGTEQLIALGTKEVYRQVDGTAHVDFDAVTGMFCMLLAV